MSPLDLLLNDVAMSWVGAAIGAAGSLLGGTMSSRGQSSANSANRDMSLQQMMFQERMARHAHRYEVIDLRKAGLNPILSGTGGAGSATPSGSTARMESVEGAGVSSAMDALAKITQALLTNQQTKKTEAETEATKAGTGLTTAKTISEQEQPGYIRAQSGLAREQTATAKETQRNIATDTLIKEIGPRVQLSEINKNNALTDLFREQGLTQQQQTQLLRVNIDQANEILKGLKNDGAINESDYGKFLRYLERTFDVMNKVPIGPKIPGSRGSHSSRDFPSYRK